LPTIRYIQDFDELAAQGPSSRELYDAMLKPHPGRVNPTALWNSAVAVTAAAERR